MRLYSRIWAADALASVLIRVPHDHVFWYPGPKTVFFWAPFMKWCLVAAGLKDLSRPADKLSVSQNVGSYLSPDPSLLGIEFFRAQLLLQLVSYGFAGHSSLYQSTILWPLWVFFFTAFGILILFEVHLLHR